MAWLAHTLAVHTMAENQPPADDWAYVPSALKEAVTVEKVREGTVLELQPSAGNDEAEQSKGFEAANMMENLRLDFLHGGEEADDDDDNMEFKLPFERMALKMEPVTKDRLVLKKVMKPGAGLVVKAGSGVSFHYNAYLEMSDEPFDSTRLRGYPHRCLLDDMIIPGLSLAVATMRKGEVARVLVGPQYAFGPMGCPPRIPANATILYEVELLHIVDGQDALELTGYTPEGEGRHLPFPVLLERCAAKRSNGKTFYDEGKHLHALKCYSSAIRAMEEVRTGNEQEDRQRSEMLLGLYNNASLCCIKTGKAGMAIGYAKRALLIAPKNARALFRVGVGLKMQGEFTDAARYLRRALAEEPNEQTIIRELRSVDSLKRQFDLEEAAMCRRMFGAGATGSDGKKDSATEGSGVSPQIQQKIRETLEEHKGRTPPSKPIPFTTGFSEAHFDYIRALSARLGLRCEDMPGVGVKVHFD
ncbi:inactive peptidyl-prolyl cis-trans isomerase FKBP6-like isoform X1 [Haemaphysalis longicornis]